MNGEAANGLGHSSPLDKPLSGSSTSMSVRKCSSAYAARSARSIWRRSGKKGESLAPTPK